MLFESISNSKYFENTLKVVILSETDLLKKKLVSQSKLVSDYFPDYQGSAVDAAAVESFFMKKFRDLYRSVDNGGIGERIMTYSADITNTEEVRKFYDWLVVQWQNPALRIFDSFSGVTGQFKN